MSKEKCIECGCTNILVDFEKSEGSCQECGFVMPTSQNNEFNNASHLYGDERTHERVSTKADLGGTFQPGRSSVDYAGKRVNRVLQRALKYSAQRTQIREKNPQLRQVKEAVSFLVGDDAMLSIERIIDACIQPYSEEDETKIKSLEQARRKDKNLKNVAQSV
ncbi:MAG: hypothetical protein VW230_02230, partial [Candidatus Poseidoniales archaeon]